MRRLIVEAALCDGCMKCVAACERHFFQYSGKNVVPKYQAAAGDELIPEEMAASGETCHSACFVRKDQAGRWVPNFCRQCPEAACLTTCMSGAIRQDPATGYLSYDSARCAACFMCVMNCPYGMPKPDAASFASVIKCDFCADQNAVPACAAACERGAVYVAEVEL